MTTATNTNTNTTNTNTLVSEECPREAELRVSFVNEFTGAEHQAWRKEWRAWHRGLGKGWWLDHAPEERFTSGLAPRKKQGEIK